MFWQASVCLSTGGTQYLVSCPFWWVYPSPSQVRYPSPISGGTPVRSVLVYTLTGTGYPLDRTGIPPAGIGVPPWLELELWYPQLKLEHPLPETRISLLAGTGVPPPPPSVGTGVPPPPVRRTNHVMLRQVRFHAERRCNRKWTNISHQWFGKCFKVCVEFYDENSVVIEYWSSSFLLRFLLFFESSVKHCLLIVGLWWKNTTGYNAY